jgi:hypothetical protein
MITINILSLCFWSVLAVLVTGILFWILVYFVIRYGLLPGLIGQTDVLIGMIGGFAGALFLAFLPTTIMPRISRRKQATRSSKTLPG